MARKAIALVQRVKILCWFLGVISKKYPLNQWFSTFFCPRPLSYSMMQVMTPYMNKLVRKIYQLIAIVGTAFRYIRSYSWFFWWNSSLWIILQLILVLSLDMKSCWKSLFKPLDKGGVKNFRRIICTRCSNISFTEDQNYVILFLDKFWWKGSCCNRDWAMFIRYDTDYRVKSKRRVDWLAVFTSE